MKFDIIINFVLIGGAILFPILYTYLLSKRRSHQNSTDANEKLRTYHKLLDVTQHNIEIFG